MRQVTKALIVSVCLAAPASAQSLWVSEGDNVLGPDGSIDPYAGLRRTSILFVEPPEPVEYRRHDLVTIIIDETTSAESSQSLETEKDWSADGEIGSFLDPWQLLELRLRGGDAPNIPLLDADFGREYTGEGDYERRDRFTTRLTAKVIEVKPNGTLLIEARERIVTDEEERVLVVTGLCRPQDITLQNTVLSGQMADLNVVLQHEGEVRQAAQKGLITRVLDALFAF